jgi:hypothetical protein
MTTSIKGTIPKWQSQITMLAYARRLGIEKQLDLRRVLAFLLPKFTDILGCRSPILAEPGGDPVST